MPKQVGIRFEDEDFRRLKKLADADGRKVANFLRRKFLIALSSWEQEASAMVLNDSKPLTYPARKRSKKSPK